MRQAYAGMLWSKQIFIYDVNQWYSGMLSFKGIFILQLKGVPKLPLAIICGFLYCLFFFNKCVIL